LDIGELLKRCVRILHISRKPTNSEFEKVAKVTALGIVVFGLVGLLISVVLNVI
jgi:protein transport protein SEC61 subunit gamma-like protein